MHSPRRKIHLRAVVIATVAMIASIGAFGMIADLADSQSATDHSDLEHHHGFTGPGSQENWPPRPTGAGAMNAALDNAELPAPAAAAIARVTDQDSPGGILGGAGPVPGVDGAPAIGDPNAEAAPSAEQLEAEPTAEPISDDPLAIALGADWVHISTEQYKNGKDGSTPGAETYFSRSNNQTVIVYQWPGASEIATFGAADLQPIVSKSESQQASVLGRQWLLDQGLAGVESLEGFSIRALDNGDLHPVRMVYVTYATSWFDDPLYSALVDMTNLVVIEGGSL